MDDNVQQNSYGFGAGFSGAPDDDNSLLGIIFAQTPPLLPSSLPRETPILPGVRPSMSSVIPSTTSSLIEPLSTVQPQALYNGRGGGHSTSGGTMLQASPSSSGSLPPFPGDARQQHGQYTPDSDDTPKRDPDPRFRTINNEGQGKCQDHVGRVKEKKGGSSGEKLKTDSPKRQSRKTSAEEESDPEEDQKRQSFLERNRKAASKCREKKKMWMANLEEECRDLEATNRMFQVELGFLRSEVFDLKNKVFQHSNCRFGPIDAFIDAQAQKVCSSASQPKLPSNTRPSASPSIGSTEFPGRENNATFELPSNMDAQSTGG